MKIVLDPNYLNFWMIFFKIHKLKAKGEYLFELYMIFLNLLTILFCSKSIIPNFVALV